MLLPDNFSFNQQNLQDFVDCPRRFYLRYLLKLEWPALESQPVREQEELLKLGEQFHRMVQQQFAGVPVATIENAIHNPELLLWWQQFSTLNLNSLSARKTSETLLSIPFNGYRLVAKFDLLVFEENGRALIYDWKTSQHQPKRKWLQSRMQTRVYPLVLSLSGPNQKPNISPDRIQMIYWYPAFPEMPVQFEYSNSQMKEDSDFILRQIKDIQSRSAEVFEKTTQERRCKFCRYRSLCERGEKAGDWHELEGEDDSMDAVIDIDFESISPAD